jgi:hypothetical protein
MAPCLKECSSVLKSLTDIRKNSNPLCYLNCKLGRVASSPLFSRKKSPKIGGWIAKKGNFCTLTVAAPFKTGCLTSQRSQCTVIFYLGNLKANLNHPSRRIKTMVGFFWLETIKLYLFAHFHHFYLTWNGKLQNHLKIFGLNHHLSTYLALKGYYIHAKNPFNLEKVGKVWWKDLVFIKWRSCRHRFKNELTLEIVLNFGPKWKQEKVKDHPWVELKST